MIYNLNSMILAGVVAMGLGATAQAGVLLVAGSPGYDPDTQTGLQGGTMFVAPGWSVSNSGTAVAQSVSYVSNVNMGARAVRWDYTGAAAVELGNLGTSGGATSATAMAINNAGTAVGISNKYDGSGGSLGTRAVRWDASGTAIGLAPLSQDSNGVTAAGAWAVNAGGTAVGWAAQYAGDILLAGTRPVRWDASGAVTELGNLGLISGSANGVALAINDVGTAVGWVDKPGTSYTAGKRAVRWGASGTIATELGNLGINSTMFSKTDILAFAVNASGTAVGWAEKWSPNGRVYQGNRAVRWDGSGTAATELGNLGLSSIGRSSGIAYAVNDAGTAAGYSEKYDSGTLVGTRAVRWDALGAVTELANLGLDVNNSTSAIAYAVNSAGTAVGYSQKYVGGSYVGDRAVIWLPDASAIDLNELGVAPVAENGTWILTTAKALSADGWVAGSGTFDPDGGGLLAGYVRHWVAQVGLGGTWTNAGGGTWGRGPNWSTGTPAMQVGNATFDLDSVYAVSLDRDELTKTIAFTAGTVTINSNGHTLATESGLSIANGATLRADGTLNLTGNLVNTGALEFEIASLLSHDQIDLSGDFNAGGTIVVKLDGYAPANGDTFDLMDFVSFVNNGYAFDFTHAVLSAGLQWDWNSFATTGSIGVVPEPGTLALLGMGAIGLLGYAWRRRKA